MLSKAVKIFIALLCLLALAAPSSAKSAAGEIPSLLEITPPAGAFVSTEANPTNLYIGETALVSIKLNNVPVEGYKSAEFTCTYNAGLLEKSNIAVTDLFGADPVIAIHDPQNGSFIVAIAGAISNRAMTSGTAFSFSAKGLQAGQSAVQCTARVSRGDNLAIDVPSIGSALTILESGASPTPFVSATPGEHEHATPVSTALEPTPLPAGSLSGQLLASKPVTVRLLDANQVEITSVLANPDGTFIIMSTPGDYILVATASGFLSYQGSLSITDGNEAVFPPESLLAGDVDGNNVIDQFDALTIGMNYTASTPEAADLNNDGVIDFLDLELLAENYRQTGPTTGTSYSILSLLQKKPAATKGPKQTVIAPTATSSRLPGPQQTVIAPTATQSTGTTGAGTAFAGAPLCPTHDPTKWHGLWDSVQGCHYDHEHGTSPFTSQVAAAFPGFDLYVLLGSVQISHTNPSSPIENVHQHGGKHGGNKWQVDVAAPQGCITGFEDGTIAIDAYAIQYHAFGRQDIEFEARNHSSVALLRQCTSSNPSDKGYIFVNQLQEYGQRVMPYQGMVLPYPNNFQPQYSSPSGQYFTTECFGQSITVDGQLVQCRPTFNDGSNNGSLWTSKVTGTQNPANRPSGSTVFTLLARWRDQYQRLDVRDLVHPFTWMFVCGGANYNSAGCRYNNSTATIHEVAGRIPASWDNLAGFDTNPIVGRITAQGFVTQFGALNLGCTAAGGNCYPIKMVNAFVGFYSSELSAAKVSNPTPDNTPERDIYFCGTSVCTETSPGAVPSGWIGAEN